MVCNDLELQLLCCCHGVADIGVAVVVFSEDVAASFLAKLWPFFTVVFCWGHDSAAICCHLMWLLNNNFGARVCSLAFGSVPT